MVFRLTVLVLALVVAGCAGRPAEPNQVYFATGLERVDTPDAAVVVQVANLPAALEVEDIRLVGPEDRSAVAPRESYRTTRERRAPGARPTVGVGAYGGSRSGINPVFGLSLPLLDWSWLRGEAAAPRTVTARVPLPEGFLDDPKAWEVEVALKGPDETRITRTLPAPQQNARTAIKRRRCAGGDQIEKDAPQPHELVAFGFLISK